MIDERTEEDATLYALGSLSADDAARFEERLTSEPELRALVRELGETAASLAHLAPAHRPPPQLRSRLEASVRGSGESTGARGLWPSWVPWAMVATLLAVAGWLGFERLGMQRELAALRDRDAFAQLRIATITSQLEGVPASIGSVAWDGGTQRGVLTIEKLPPLDPSQDYQLWVIDPNYKQPVSGGIVRVDDKGGARFVFTVDVPIRAADKFAISRERKGGAATAEGPIVMIGQ